jgi:hypothetical protein
MSEILVAYTAGIKAAFAVVIGAVGVSFIISLFSKWNQLNAYANKGVVAA